MENVAKSCHEVEDRLLPLWHSHLRQLNRSPFCKFLSYVLFSPRITDIPLELLITITTSAMENTRQVIRVDAAGRSGMHGSSTEDYIPHPPEARLGSNGLHGQSATSPTPGGRAQDVRVRLFYDENVSGAVRIAGEGGAWEGKLFSALQGQVYVYPHLGFSTSSGVLIHDLQCAF